MARAPEGPAVATDPSIISANGGDDTGEAAATGIDIPRRLTRGGVDPFDEIEWEKRTATIRDDTGAEIFSQDDVEAPATWSMLATTIAASKYFYGEYGTPQRETSVRQLVHRVCRTIADWGRDDGYFATADAAQRFYDELAAVCVNQVGAFNSPVWFNVGLSSQYGISAESRMAYAWDRDAQDMVLVRDTYRYPQTSACFIQAVDDSLDDIMRLASSEATLFKYGSGTGTDLSTIRSRKETLSGGGTPSGPLSFMRVFDQVAGVIRSGGKTRRAAKMQSLKVDHPDIMDFITCKRDEERKAHALIGAGYDGSFNGEAYASVMFQNANLSVRVSDEFMDAVVADGRWRTRAVLTGEPMDDLSAREVLRAIAECTHACGDPGLQYDTTINRRHTCANTSRIHASNPCSEYMFVNDSACNLASVNLMAFIGEDNRFDIETFRHVVRLMIVAQDILIDRSSYPSAAIALNSHRYRPLGLGYANLGAAIMRQGLAYDSDAARGFAAGVTALMTGSAYEASAELARARGPFSEHEANRTSMAAVIAMHWADVDHIDADSCPGPILEAARAAWKRATDEGEAHGFHNAQVTVLAPTGTIGFLMDCDTTGVEPDIALVKYKQLAGGGAMKIVNGSVPAALRQLGYDDPQTQRIAEYIQKHDTIEGAPEIEAAHLPVFDCAMKPANGERVIGYRAHLAMMAAVQPFLSGAISKTINMPEEVSPADIMQAYIDAWKMGLKAVAIYRDGSKRIQPVRTDAAEEAPADVRPRRRHMPETRNSITHKFDISGHEGYLTVGLYEDGEPGELFITMAKEGSTIGGLMDAFGISISMCLQYGVPLKVVVNKFSHARFEPSGFTKNKDIRMAKSIVDYISRWLALTFLPDDAGDAAEESEPAAPAAAAAATAHLMTDAPACDQCGAITVRNGTCYRCYNCGNSMGCS